MKSFNKLSQRKNKNLNLSFQYLIESFNPFFPKNGLGVRGMKSPALLVGHRPPKTMQITENPQRQFSWIEFPAARRGKGNENPLADTPPLAAGSFISPYFPLAK
ncbi:MAG: hypothetical protein IIC13_03470 [SAR324 cluster bacterium]|nr:hypothetical protein [SAR324 cluster bacterium]